VKNEGYEVAHDGKCITVFSAPNYWWVLAEDLMSVLYFLKWLPYVVYYYCDQF
jgi:hypothetical protein